MKLKKKWERRDTEDPEYKKLGDTPDARRARADNIELEINNNWKWILTTLIALLGLIIAICR